MSKLSLMYLELIIFVIKFLNCLEFSMRRPGSGSISTFMFSSSAIFATLVTPSRNIFSSRLISWYCCCGDDNDGGGGAGGGAGGGTGPPGSVDRCFAPIFFCKPYAFNCMLYTHLSAILYPRRMVRISNCVQCK